MQPKKKNILEKIIKKDYNDELEKILEEKNFGENVKSTLLSILYKIEAAYKDLETVKKDVETKDEYILNILEIIKNDCNSIKIIKMNDEENKIPDNKTYIINTKEKEIIAYPIERKLLYAIAKIGKKDKIIKEDYFIISKTLSELINVGNNINIVEPLRDFNGYSWTTIPQEIESIDHNLIYQNLRIIVGYEFLNKWIKNNQFIIDYFELFKEKLEDNYGKENRKKFIDVLIKISILLSAKFSDGDKEKILKEKNKLEEELNKTQNKELYIENTISKKIQITEKIKEIDTIINNKDLLKEEYIKRNKELALDKKIFSIRVLAQIMEQERDNYFKDLEELNKLINPQNFVKYTKDIEEKYKYLKIIDVENIEEELDKLKIKLQLIFLDMIKININKAETKQEIEKLIYNLRYYLLLPYNYEKNVQEIKELQKKINEVSLLLIDKAVKLKVIQRISKNEKYNYEILKKIFNIRIIKLEDAYLKITKEKEKYFVKIFDENMFEQKDEISKPKDLEIKLNKKIPIWG